MADIDETTKQRGQNYGRPIDHFDLAQRIRRELVDAFKDCQNLKTLSAEEMRSFEHFLQMFADKFARLCHDPKHYDSLHDIVGYANCLKACLFGGEPWDRRDAEGNVLPAEEENKAPLGIRPCEKVACRCPHCKTVEAPKDTRPGGFVKCGRCGHLYVPANNVVSK